LKHRNLGASVVDVRAEGGDELIVVVLVALQQRLLFEHVGAEVGETLFMVVDVLTYVPKCWAK
jgi:hypothetical protein